MLFPLLAVAILATSIVVLIFMEIYEASEDSKKTVAGVGLCLSTACVVLTAVDTIPSYTYEKKYKAYVDYKQGPKITIKYYNDENTEDKSIATVKCQDEYTVEDLNENDMIIYVVKYRHYFIGGRDEVSCHYILPDKES